MLGTYLLTASTWLFISDGLSPIIVTAATIGLLFGVFGIWGHNGICYIFPNSFVATCNEARNLNSNVRIYLYVLFFLILGYTVYAH